MWGENFYTVTARLSKECVMHQTSSRCRQTTDKQSESLWTSVGLEGICFDVLMLMNDTLAKKYNNIQQKKILH